MESKIDYWLKEGKQSKITPSIRKIVESFKGSDLEKVFQILKWINKNLRHCKNQKMVEKIFATRTADELIKSKKHTGCHDVNLVFVVLARASGIPTKYLAGLGKETMKGGHCVSEIFINGRWSLVDSSVYKIEIFPEFSEFFNKFYVMGIGIDSWDINIRTLKDWYKRAKEISEQIRKIK
ncbi:MAG: transglutaminase-like domain-containing protein [Nanoarchaeota archaeon]|nr:transglutaminase-like domain-containing protein [Nanoarchaeota archaeon]